jgi:murein L,D-transpeptidase YcbB/YkuD
LLASTYKFTGSAGTIDDMVAYALTLRSDVNYTDTRLLNEILRVSGLITDEESARISGDAAASTARSAIQSSLNSEITRATAAEGVNATAVATETARAEAAEGVLQNNITAEQSARQLAISTKLQQGRTKMHMKRLRGLPQTLTSKLKLTQKRHVSMLS